MANRSKEERDEIFEIVTNYYLKGVTKQYQMMKVAGVDYKTAGKYIELAKQGIDEAIKITNRQEILKREIVSLDSLEYIAWSQMGNADNVNHLAGILNTILKIKEKRIELLDLKRIIYGVIKEESEKREDNKPLDFESHDWLIMKMQADGIIGMNEEYKRGERDRHGEKIKK